MACWLLLLFLFCQSSGCKVDLSSTRFRYVKDGETCDRNIGACFYTVNTLKKTVFYRMIMICCEKSEPGTQHVNFCTSMAKISERDKTNDLYHILPLCDDCCTFASIDIEDLTFTNVFCSCTHSHRESHHIR